MKYASACIASPTFQSEVAKEGMKQSLHAPSPIKLTYHLYTWCYDMPTSTCAAVSGSYTLPTLLSNARYRQKGMFPHPIHYFKDGAWCVLNSAPSARLKIGLCLIQVKIYKLGCCQHLGSMLSMIVMNHGSSAINHSIIRGETKHDKAIAASCVVYLASELLFPNYSHVITPLPLPL